MHSALKPFLKPSETFKQITGRRKILEVYQATSNLRQSGPLWAIESDTHITHLLEWPQARATLTPANQVFCAQDSKPGHRNTTVLPFKFFETVTQKGTQHVDWMQEFECRKQSAVYELPEDMHDRRKESLRELLELLPEEGEHGRWSVLVFPHAHVVITLSACAGGGKGVCHLYYSKLVATGVRLVIERCAQILGESKRRTYPELIQRCMQAG